MKVSYGEPGNRGVTTLMAVGADDIDNTAAEAALNKGTVVALAASAVGFLLGIKTVRNMGLGGALALYGVRLMLKQPQVVTITQPVPPQ